MENTQFKKLMESSNLQFENLAKLNESTEIKLNDIKIDSILINTLIIILKYNGIKYYLEIDDEGYGSLKTDKGREFIEDEDDITEFEEEFQFIWKNRLKFLSAGNPSKLKFPTK